METIWDSHLNEKLRILADAAKYDAACTSSGVDRKNGSMGTGNAVACGICHSFSADGRCISLLKILLTNDCCYDCVYCVNRVGNDTERATFSPDEVCTLTMGFYRRNYIEGLFLSSAVYRNPSYTMELIYAALYKLRHVCNFQGYIHVKAIPGADPILIQKVGFLADRMSVNLELPTAEGLKRLAPNKKPKNLIRPIQQIQRGIQTQRVALGKDSRMERAKGNQYLSNSIFNEKNVSDIHGKSVVSLMEGTQKNETNIENNKDNLHDKDFLPSDFLQNMGKRTQSRFVPAGQSTQMIIGASGESDFHLLSLTQQLYQQYDMKRVFYSAYVPLNDDPELPAIGTAPPLLREHRLYQADWLLRYYGFQADELLSSDRPNFNTFVDPKCDWALRHLEYFPIEINQASYEQLLRVPGIGNKSAGRIVRARRQAALDFEDIKKMGVVLKRAVYFITCRGKMKYHTPIEEDFITRQLIGTNQKDNWKIEHPTTYRQLSLFDDFNLT